MSNNRPVESSALRHGRPQFDVSFLSAYGVDASIIDIWRNSFPKLLPIQTRAVTEFGLFSGENLLIFAPTSSGKTFVGEMAAVSVARRRKRVFYLLPLKSLAQEKFDEFRERYDPIGLKVAVSSRDRREYDRSIERGDFDIAIVVFEKMDSLLLQRPTLLADVGLVVVDEMQMLSDPNRGPRLELLLSKTLAFAKEAQIIGLSAVLQKSQSIRDWVGARLLEEHRRPVELRKGVFYDGVFRYMLHNEGLEGEEQFDVQANDVPLSHALLGLVEALARRGEQSLVFLRDKTSTIEMARLFAEHSSLPPAEGAVWELQGLSEASRSKDVLVSLLSNGVAFHNADLSYPQRKAIENGFRNGEVRIIFCTTTLGMGVNLPAKNVIIDNKRWEFSREFGQMHLVDLEKGQYENLGGRAGRLSLEPQFGRSILVSTSEFDAKRLTETYVQGGFDEAAPRLSEMPLEDVVLNVLASSLVRTEPELLQFLLGTFTGINCWSDRKGRSSGTGEGCFEPRLHAAVQQLLDWQLLEQQEEALIPSDVGRAAARSCIQAKTGLRFSSWARDNRESGATALSILLLLDSAADASCVHVPLSRSEWQDNRYLSALWAAAEEAGELGHPVVKSLLDCTRRPSFEQMRATKRSLIMLDWIEEMPLSAIEEKYQQIWPGLVHRIGETDSWLCEALNQICHLCNWSSAALSANDSLMRRLSLGVREDAAPLCERLAGRVGRDSIRKLVANGITSLAKLKRTPLERVSEVIGHSQAVHLSSALPRAGLAEQRAGQDKRSPEPPALASIPEPDDCSEESFELVIDTRNMSVNLKGGVKATLTPRSFKFLLTLARRAPQFVHKEEIYEALWGASHPDSLPYERQIADHKGRLLKALLEAAGPETPSAEQRVRDLVVSKYGLGYRLALSQKEIKIIE